MNQVFRTVANRVLDAYASVFARPVFRHWNTFLVHAGFRGLGILNYRTQTLSGERYLVHSKLPRFLGTDRPVLFDVGANEGDYSEQFLRVFTNAQIFAFEPHPMTFSRLSKRVGARVLVNQVALGAEVGNARLYDRNDNGSSHASLNESVLSRIHSVAEPASVKVEVNTLDAFVDLNGVQQIDFLKIDTEGNELDVLKGATRLLRAGRIRFIQFEFNEMNVTRRIFLDDFRETLPNHELFRLLPQALMSVERAPLIQDVFAFQNFLAVPTSEIDRCGLLNSSVCSTNGSQ